MLSIAFVLFCLLSAVVLLGWALIALFNWADTLPRPPGGSRTQARYEPDRAQLRKLQAKRRLALRHLGSRWVLHRNQPAVKWGNGRG